MFSKLDCMDKPDNAVKRKIYGTGLKNKQIEFVPASEDTARTETHQRSVCLAADRYLSIVLKRSADAPLTKADRLLSGREHGASQANVT